MDCYFFQSSSKLPLKKHSGIFGHCAKTFHHTGLHGNVIDESNNAEKSGQTEEAGWGLGLLDNWTMHGPELLSDLDCEAAWAAIML